MKIQLLIDFNSFTDELAKLLNGNIPSWIGGPPPAPRPPPNHGALPLRAGTPGPGPGRALGTAPREVVFHRISFKIFGLDLAGEGGSLTSAGSRLARMVLAAPHLLRGRQGGNPETVPAGAASPAPHRKCTSLWTQVAFQVLENLPGGPRPSQNRTQMPLAAQRAPFSRPGGSVLSPVPLLSGHARHACVPTAGHVASHSRVP